LWCGHVQGPCDSCWSGARRHARAAAPGGEGCGSRDYAHLGPFLYFHGHRLCDLRGDPGSLLQPCVPLLRHGRSDVEDLYPCGGKHVLPGRAAQRDPGRFLWDSQQRQRTSGGRECLPAAGDRDLSIDFHWRVRCGRKTWHTAVASPAWRLSLKLDRSLPQAAAPHDAPSRWSAARRRPRAHPAVRFAALGMYERTDLQRPQHLSPLTLSNSSSSL
jgi:hypothetical protein